MHTFFPHFWGIFRNKEDRRHSLEINWVNWLPNMLQCHTFFLIFLWKDLSALCNRNHKHRSTLDSEINVWWNISKVLLDFGGINEFDLFCTLRWFFSPHYEVSLWIFNRRNTSHTLNEIPLISVFACIFASLGWHL